MTPLKTGFHLTPFYRWKRQRGLGTIRHGQATPQFVSNKLNYKSLQGFCPLLLCNIRASSLSDLGAKIVLAARHSGPFIPTRGTGTQD